MDRNVRDKLYKKKFKMPSRKEELIVFIVDALNKVTINRTTCCSIWK